MTAWAATRSLAPLPPLPLRSAVYVPDSATSLVTVIAPMLAPGAVPVAARLPSPAIAAMAISGVPPLNGFASKWLVYQGTLDAAGETKWAGVFLAAAVFGSALTLASFVKVLHSVFLGQRGSATKDKKAVGEPISIAVPLVVLAVFCVLFGVFAGPTLRSVVIPSVESTGAQVHPA